MLILGDFRGNRLLRGSIMLRRSQINESLDGLPPAPNDTSCRRYYTVVTTLHLLIKLTSMLACLSQNFSYGSLDAK